MISFILGVDFIWKNLIFSRLETNIRTVATIHRSGLIVFWCCVVAVVIVVLGSVYVQKKTQYNINFFLFSCCCLPFFCFFHYMFNFFSSNFSNDTFLPFIVRFSSIFFFSLFDLSFILSYIRSSSELMWKVLVFFVNRCSSEQKNKRINLFGRTLGLYRMHTPYSSNFKCTYILVCYDAK